VRVIYGELVGFDIEALGCDRFGQVGEVRYKVGANRYGCCGFVDEELKVVDGSGYPDHIFRRIEIVDQCVVVVNEAKRLPPFPFALPVKVPYGIRPVLLGEPGPLPWESKGDFVDVPSSNRIDAIGSEVAHNA